MPIPVEDVRVPADLSGGFGPPFLPALFNLVYGEKRAVVEFVGRGTTPVYSAVPWRCPHCWQPLRDPPGPGEILAPEDLTLLTRPTAAEVKRYAPGKTAPRPRLYLTPEDAARQAEPRWDRYVCVDLGR